MTLQSTTTATALEGQEQEVKDALKAVLDELQNVLDANGELKSTEIASLTATVAELNYLDNDDLAAADLQKLADTTASAAELNELDLSAVGALSKWKKINMTAADFADNTEVSTGWSLPDTAIVKGVYINVNTKEDTAGTKTINVGTDNDGDSGDDADGFLAGVSVATAGLVKGTLLNTGQTLGALLAVDEDGAGTLVPEPCVNQGGNTITVTAGDASGFAEADFDILIEYSEVA